MGERFQRILFCTPLQNAAPEIPRIKTLLPQFASVLLAANTDRAVADHCPVTVVVFSSFKLFRSYALSSKLML